MRTLSLDAPTVRGDATSPLHLPEDPITHTTVDSPLGPLTLVGRGETLTGLYLPDHQPAPNRATFGAEDPDGFSQARSELAGYFAGSRTVFTVPLAPVGTPFQLEVWQVLREIAYGETMTYGEIAVRVGRPTAVRAVGAANGRNPLSIVVGCHRVVGSGGALTGYAGGLDRKRWLLDLEQRVTDSLGGPGGDATSLGGSKDPGC